MNKTSLKEKLNQLIKARGEVPYQEIKEKCESGFFGKYYRITTAERRLRNESPQVEAIYKDGYIVAYKSKNPIQWRRMAVKDCYGNIEKYINLPVEEEKRY